MSRDEEARRARRSRVDAIAHKVFEYADETVAHAENVSKEELMLTCYHELGELLRQWGKKLDKIQRVDLEPRWLKEYVTRKESVEGRPSVGYDSSLLGFAVDNLFFGKESADATLSDDALMISEPRTMLMEDFKELVNFCETNGLDFYVDGFNTSLPGRAFRVVVYKPKHGARQHLDFRESAMAALQLFKELSTSSDGSILAIEREVFVNALVKRSAGKLDNLVASKILDTLISSRQIPASKII